MQNKDIMKTISTFGTFEDLIDSKNVCDYKKSNEIEFLLELKKNLFEFIIKKVPINKIFYWINLIIFSNEKLYIIHFYKSLFNVKRNFLLKFLIKIYKKKVNKVIKFKKFEKYKEEVLILMNLNNKLKYKNKILKKKVFQLNYKNLK